MATSRHSKNVNAIYALELKDINGNWIQVETFDEPYLKGNIDFVSKTANYRIIRRIAELVYMSPKKLDFCLKK